jgi:hypothetical protein
VVNQAKTDFYKKDCIQVTISIGHARITSKKQISILGVIFDSKLQWIPHTNSAIAKANKSLTATYLIKRYFNTKELIQLLTSNFYSVLCYNIEVWLLKSLHHTLKHSLLVASSNAFKLTLHYPRYILSFNDLHALTNRATLSMFCEC